MVRLHGYAGRDVGALRVHGDLLRRRFNDQVHAFQGNDPHENPLAQHAGPGETRFVAAADRRRNDSRLRCIIAQSHLDEVGKKNGGGSDGPGDPPVVRDEEVASGEPVRGHNDGVRRPASGVRSVVSART